MQAALRSWTVMSLNMDLLIPLLHAFVIMNLTVSFVFATLENIARKTIRKKGRRMNAGDIVNSAIREFYNSAAIIEYLTFKRENNITSSVTADNTIALPATVWRTC